MLWLRKNFYFGIKLIAIYLEWVEDRVKGRGGIVMSLGYLLRVHSSVLLVEQLLAY